MKTCLEASSVLNKFIDYCSFVSVHNLGICTFNVKNFSSYLYQHGKIQELIYLLCDTRTVKISQEKVSQNSKGYRF